jgi:hypothetical protein
MTNVTSRAVKGFAPVLLLAIVSCGPSQQVKEKLAQLQSASAEKDSLMTEVAQDARLMSDISAEIARVQAKSATPNAAAGEEAQPVTITRESILNGVKGLTARLDSVQTRLASAQRRARSLRGSTAKLQKTIADLQSTVANQKQVMLSLTERANELQQQNTQLVVQNATLTDTVSAMTTRDNTVYYVIGTKAQLESEGLVREVGGSHVLFIFGKRGTVLVPARQLTPAEFTAADLRNVDQIPLPDSSKAYRIVSRQDLSALETLPDEHGYVRGAALRIADPQRFWAHARYLIIVQKS